MSNTIWKAPPEIQQLLEVIKNKNHSPRLDQCSVVVCFDEGKPFVKNKLNLGKLSKFSAMARLYQKDKHDFCLVVPSTLWQEMLNAEQRKAYLDLQLTRCDMEYVPETVEENGKKKKIVDELGRIQYSNEPKYEPAVRRHLEVARLEPKLFLCEKGDVLFWHADLIHGGARRRNLQLSRKALVCHYFAQGALTYHDLSGNLTRLHRNGPYAPPALDEP